MGEQPYQRGGWQEGGRVESYGMGGNLLMSGSRVPKSIPNQGFWTLSYPPEYISKNSDGQACGPFWLLYALLLANH